MVAHLLAVLLCSLSLHARAETLHLVSGDAYAPFTGKELPGGGILTQVVQAALVEAGIFSSLAWRPWNRGYRMTLLGQYDATFPYVRTVERERDYLYSAPLYFANQHLFSRAEDLFEADDLRALRGKRICYPLGWQPPAAIQQLLDEGVLQRHAPAGLNECARLLLLKRDDFFVANRHLGEAALRSTGEPLTRFHHSSSVFSSSTLHLIVPRRHPRGAAIIARFNQGLASLQASGEYQRLVEAYLQQVGQAPSLPEQAQ